MADALAALPPGGRYALAFELFTGQLPFTGKNSQETMIARLRGAPTPLRDVKADLPGKLETLLADPARLRRMKQAARRAARPRAAEAILKLIEG